VIKNSTAIIQDSLAALKSKLHEEKSGHVLVESTEQDGEGSGVPGELDGREVKLFLALRGQMERSYEQQQQQQQ